MRVDTEEAPAFRPLKIVALADGSRIPRYACPPEPTRPIIVKAAFTDIATSHSLSTMNPRIWLGGCLKPKRVFIIIHVRI